MNADEFFAHPFITATEEEFREYYEKVMPESKKVGRKEQLEKKLENEELRLKEK